MAQLSGPRITGAALSELPVIRKGKKRFLFAGCKLNDLKEVHVKKGLILYITGGNSSRLNEDDLNINECLGIKADLVEIISSQSGHHDIHTAAWRLTAAGMQKIECVAAEYTSATNIRLIGKAMRLCG